MTPLAAGRFNDSCGVSTAIPVFGSQRLQSLRSRNPASRGAATSKWPLSGIETDRSEFRLGVGCRDKFNPKASIVVPPKEMLVKACGTVR